MSRLVQAYLHSDLHHRTAKDEGGVSHCPLRWKWPGTEKTQSFDDVMVRLIPDRVPDQIAQRFCEVFQKGRSGGIAASCYSDDSPE